MKAAEILASTRQSLQTVVDELRATRVESARSQALNTKARLPAAHDSLKFIEGEQILAKAEEALQAGELILAVSRFKAAKDQFEVALREAAAIEGRDNVARVHAGASALGARESDLLFAQGIEQEQAAAGHLEVLRFSEAKQMFDLAHDSFDNLIRYLEEQSIAFDVGSTPEEIEQAIALCDAYVTECSAARYASEAQRAVSLRPVCH